MELLQHLTSSVLPKDFELHSQSGLFTKMGLHLIKETTIGRIAVTAIKK